MTSTFIFHSPAKINLDLKVIDKKPDGYHLIESNFQILSFFDEIEVKLTNTRKVNFRTDISLLDNSENIAFKAINFMDQYKINDLGLDIFLKKKIPIGSGLGGGSSNAASVLLILNHFYNAKLSIEYLKNIAKHLGADVPFFLDGYNCFVSGIGEILKRVKRKKKYYLLFFPNINCSTKKVFGAFKFNNSLHNQTLQNELKFAIFDSYPELKKIYNNINKTLSVNFSGTGSTFFAEFENYREAEFCKNSFKITFPCIITEGLESNPVHLQIKQMGSGQVG